MLKITLHDSAKALRFCLEGKLAGLWVRELRQCWDTASSTTHGRHTVLDLTEVDFVDDAGVSLLGDMHRAGVSFEASTPLMRSVVDGISREPSYGRVEEKNLGSSDALVCADPSGPHARAV